MKRLRILERPRMKPMILLATILVFVLFLFILNMPFWSGTLMKQTEGTIGYLEPSWQIRGPDGAAPQAAPGDFLTLEAGKTYEMSTILTYDGNWDTVPAGFLQVEHMYCRLLLDGNVKFQHMPEDVVKLDHSRSPGLIYKAFRLPEDCKGHTLTLELHPVLPHVSSYELPEISFGDYKSMAKDMIKKDIPHNVVMILCMMMGISALIFSTASFTGSDYREGFNIGSFSLLVSVYFLTTCRTNYYFLGNPYYLYFTGYLVASLMPVSFMGVMRECMTGIHRRICTAVIVLQMLFFTGEMYLHLTGILDMQELLPVLHMISIGEMGLNSLLFLTMKDRKRKKTMAFQLLPILLGMSLDIILAFSPLADRWKEGTFTTLGVLIFLLLQLTAKLVSQGSKVFKMQRRTIEGMATLIESRDGSTGAHVRNTGVYAKMIAKEMYRRRMYKKEIDNEFVDRMGWMAPLHDVGKIKISDVILNKPGKFTPEEYEIMKTHAAMGGQVIRDIMQDSLDPETLEMAVNIATYHHERWDGTGYPEGRKGTEIPLCARIMAAADVFDALSSKRVYKPSMEIDQVFEEMVKNRGTQFQKEIVDVVLSLRPQLEAYLEKTRKQEK